MPIRLHPSAPEAVVLHHNHLTRWALTDPPRPLAAAPLGHTARLREADLLAVAPGGDLLATVVTTGWESRDPAEPLVDWVQVRRWADFAVVATLPVAENGTGSTQVAWAPDGRHLATADRTLSLWTWPQARRVAQLPLADFTSALAFHPAGEALAVVTTGPEGPTMGLVAVGPRQLTWRNPHLEAALLTRPRAATMPVTRARAEFTPNGQFVAIYTCVEWGRSVWRSWDGEISFFAAATGEPWWCHLLNDDAPLGGPARAIRMFASEVHFTPDSQTVLYGTPGGTLVSFDTVHLNHPWRIERPGSEGVQSFALEAAGRRIWTLQAGVPIAVPLPADP
jgi:hypothetical protein